MPDSRSISRKIALRRYRKSANNTEVQTRYAASEHGAASRRGIEQRYRDANKPKIAAKRAVAHAVRRRRLPRARNLPCFDCLGDAAEYHHPSYAREDRLKVVPLCRPCHKARHFSDQTAAIEALGLIRGWKRQGVLSHLRVPDRFGRAGYRGMTILNLACGHLKSVRGSQAVPKTALCSECANQHPAWSQNAGISS